MIWFASVKVGGRDEKWVKDFREICHASLIKNEKTGSKYENLGRILLYYSLYFSVYFEIFKNGVGQGRDTVSVL